MNWVGGRAHASQRSIDDKIVDFFVSNMISLRVRNCNYSFYVVDPDPLENSWIPIANAFPDLDVAFFKIYWQLHKFVCFFFYISILISLLVV